MKAVFDLITRKVSERTEKLVLIIYKLPYWQKKKDSNLPLRKFESFLIIYSFFMHSIFMPAFLSQSIPDQSMAFTIFSQAAPRLFDFSAASSREAPFTP